MFSIHLETVKLAQQKVAQTDSQADRLAHGLCSANVFPDYQSAKAAISLHVSDVPVFLPNINFVWTRLAFPRSLSHVK